MTQMATIVLSLSDDYVAALKYPAATSRGQFYLIKDNAIVGRVRRSTAYSAGNGIYTEVTIEPDDEATRKFFKDDPTVVSLGTLYGLRYDGVTGKPMPNIQDGELDRHKGTEIVDTVEFDFGIAHPRYASVKGWANCINKPKPRVHTQQRRRRPRCSHKIKKVM